MTRPARILIVSPRYPPAQGGVERHVAVLARGLRARGVDVRVVTTDPSGSLPADHVADGVPVRRFGTIRGNDVYFLSPGLSAWLATHARDVDLVHAASYHTPLALAAAAGARLAGRPFVLTPYYHGTGHTQGRARLHRPYRIPGGRMVRSADAIIACSEAEAALLRDHFGHALPITVIPLGVDAAQYASAEPFAASDDRPLVLAGGRLEAYKQVDVVVAAMAALPGHRLAVFGSGPAAPAVEAAVREAGAGDRVTLLGRVSDEDLRRWYRTADVYVTMSRKESFGLTVLEAVAAGAAVVASDIPAYAEQTCTLPPEWLRLVGVDAPPACVAAAIVAAGRRADRGSVPAIRGWDASVVETTALYRHVFAQRGRIAWPAADEDLP